MMNRKDILKKITSQQEKVVKNLEDSVERYKVASDLEETDELSRQTEAKDMQLRYENMLRAAENNLTFLINQMEETHTEIAEGALVSTDKNYLFVGISVPVFEFEGKKVISFSDDAPIFKEIKNKRTGDQVKFGDLDLEILSIQ